MQYYQSFLSLSLAASPSSPTILLIRHTEITAVARFWPDLAFENITQSIRANETLLKLLEAKESRIKLLEAKAGVLRAGTKGLEGVGFVTPVNNAHVIRQKNKDMGLIRDRWKKTEERLADATTTHKARGKMVNDLDMEVKAFRKDLGILKAVLDKKSDIIKELQTVIKDLKKK
ncbi:uncharacterized protein PAC_18400 [Phialocephala subalpina]|uniref:Uncharacterized protein n=1 Tax=Phialocephala subalpina TaxID=576137 RepID=A0A1L7XTY7_9HELO|nr:uncharacterized protein PAC_18400 [Phialocephala subalpina]